MTRGLWVKLDVSFFENRKVVQAGRDAAWLYLQMLCLAKRTLSDGVITDAQARLLGGRRASKWCTLCAQATLIERASDNTGWHIIGWEEDNKSAAEIAEIREKRRSAGRQGGLARARNEANAKQLASNDSSTVLKPETETETETETAAASSPTSRARGSGSDDGDDDGGELAAKLLKLAGIDDAQPNKRERQLVADATTKGWTVAELEDKAARAGLDDVNHPRPYLLKSLTECAQGKPDDIWDNLTHIRPLTTEEAKRGGWTDETVFSQVNERVSDTPPAAAATGLAVELLQRAGVSNARPTASERRAVTDALAAGYSETQLIERAARASLDTNPRTMLGTMLAACAAAPATAAPNATGREQPQ
jgi:hypothetical protein